MSEWLENKQHRQYAIYLLYWQIYIVRMDFRWVMVLPWSQWHEIDKLYLFIFFYSTFDGKRRVEFKVNFRSIINIHQYQHFESMTSKILIDFCYCCYLFNEADRLLLKVMNVTVGLKCKHTHKHNCAHFVSIFLA